MRLTLSNRSVRSSQTKWAFEAYTIPLRSSIDTVFMSHERTIALHVSHCSSNSVSHDSFEQVPVTTPSFLIPNNVIFIVLLQRPYFSDPVNFTGIRTMQGYRMDQGIVDVYRRLLFLPLKNSIFKKTLSEWRIDRLKDVVDYTDKYAQIISSSRSDTMSKTVLICTWSLKLDKSSNGGSF